MEELAIVSKRPKRDQIREQCLVIRDFIYRKRTRLPTEVVILFKVVLVVQQGSRGRMYETDYNALAFAY
jgi:hypothetical protein